MEVVVWDVWDMPVFDSAELDPPLDCGESGVGIADLRPGDYLIEVWAYDADFGYQSFDGAAGMTVEPAGEAWTEVVLERS
jgi:hypothetical protein